MPTTNAPLDPQTRALAICMADGSPWEWAPQLFGLQFTGDINPIDHGGLFYSTADWVEYGYADAIRLDTSEGVLFVTIGTINKPERSDMADAFRCCGTPEEFQQDVGAQIEACDGYWGVEADQNRTYRLDEWKEWRIWKSLIEQFRGIEDKGRCRSCCTLIMPDLPDGTRAKFHPGCDHCHGTGRVENSEK